MAKCDWEPFFIEFTDKMLSYYQNNNVTELIEKLCEMYQKSGLEIPACGSDIRGNNLLLNDSRLKYVDPFTVLTFMTDGPDAIKQNCKAASSVFEMKNHFPDDYDGMGIPITKQIDKKRVGWFFEKRYEHDSNGSPIVYDNDKRLAYLQDFFESAIKMRTDSDNSNVKKQFVKLYENFPKKITWGFTSSYVTGYLMLIAPHQFVGLDDECKNYIKETYPDLSEHISLKQDDCFSGYDYVNLCENLKFKLDETGETLSDLFYESCLANNSDQKTARQKSNEIKSEIINLLRQNNYSFFDNVNNRNYSYARYSIDAINHHPNYYWLTPSPSRLNACWYLILYDAIKQLVYLFKINDSELTPDDFEVYQSDANPEMLELRIAYDDPDFTEKNKNIVKFAKYLVNTYKYDPSLHTLTEISMNYAKGGKNVIYYGIPGCGKSYSINNELRSRTSDEYIERIVFHPDYTYSDFVGQIMPKIKRVEGHENQVSYEFLPGPFTRVLSKAFNDPENKYYLIIEEVNRGNAPAIFGDIFQLLDRDENGRSEYNIKNADIALELRKIRHDMDDDIKKDADVYIPSNLSIICTMNTSDQNVFTLDTAFQRRFQMIYVPDTDNTNIGALEIGESENNGRGTGIGWSEFHNKINEQISNRTFRTSGDDKRLGYYFCTPDEIKDLRAFTNKVLKYLWDDAFKIRRADVFSDNIHTFEDIVERLTTHELDESEKSTFFGIFKEDLFNERD